jgi:hypothetical protein
VPGHHRQRLVVDGEPGQPADLHEQRGMRGSGRVARIAIATTIAASAAVATSAWRHRTRQNLGNVTKTPVKQRRPTKGVLRLRERAGAGAGSWVARDRPAHDPVRTDRRGSPPTLWLDSPDSAHVWELPTHRRSLVKRPASRLGAGPFRVLFIPATQREMVFHFRCPGQRRFLQSGD